MVLMNLRTGTLGLLITAACVAFVSTATAQECSEWKVRKLEAAPDWYTKALAVSAGTIRAEVADSLRETEYVLNDSTSLIHREVHTLEVFDTIRGYHLEAPDSFWLYGSDTARLDSNLMGFTSPSFDPSGTRFVTAEVLWIEGDGSKANIVMYDLLKGEKNTFPLRVGGPGIAAPQYQPNKGVPKVAYADWANVYVYSIQEEGAELVFARGGSYAQGYGCAYRGVSDIRWSADGERFVFKYFPSVFAPSYELYEVYRDEK